MKNENEFYRPYTAKNTFFPVVCFEGDVIFTFGICGYFEAKKMAAHLNRAFQAGMMRMFSLNELPTEKEFFKEMSEAMKP